MTENFFVVRGQAIVVRSPDYDEKKVPRAEIETWIEEAKQRGVKSIIVLLDDEQLGYYASLPKGLINTYYELRR